MIQNRRNTSTLDLGSIIEDFCNFYFEMFSSSLCSWEFSCTERYPRGQKQLCCLTRNSVDIWLRFQLKKSFLLSPVFLPAEFLYPARLSGSATSRLVAQQQQCCTLPQALLKRLLEQRGKWMKRPNSLHLATL